MKFDKLELGELDPDFVSDDGKVRVFRLGESLNPDAAVAVFTSPSGIVLAKQAISGDFALMSLRKAANCLVRELANVSMSCTEGIVFYQKGKK